MYRVLVVEDDEVIAGEITKHLQAWGLEAQAVGDLHDVLSAFTAYAPHLVLMDISLPFYNGYYWCGEIRKTSKAPVIFLSSRSDNMDIVMAMNMGGDDYLTKPVSMEVLTAKVQAMLRRAYDYEPVSRLTLRGAVLDAAALALRMGEERYELTRNEARILQSLLTNKGEIVSREQLMMALWDSDAFVDDNTLTVNVNRLRSTLSNAGLDDCIVTHKSKGYAIRE
ncbi:MAG: response regulator transcription factor [Eubacteriales bacterium]|nr:response regulator transcription factor [Eubacteriales bacterium]